MPYFGGPLANGATGFIVVVGFISLLDDVWGTIANRIACKKNLLGSKTSPRDSKTRSWNRVKQPLPSVTTLPLGFAFQDPVSQRGNEASNFGRGALLVRHRLVPRADLLSEQERGPDQDQVPEGPDRLVP